MQGSQSKKESLNYNWMVLVEQRTFDVTNFFKESFSLIQVIWAVENEVKSCFNMLTTVAEMGVGSVENCLNLFAQMSQPNS